jgi:hypothetical protein
MRIGNVVGYWSTNIGNSFFQLSAEKLLKEMGHDVFNIPDLSGYADLQSKSKNSLDLLSYYSLDALVLHGPMFRSNITEIMASLLEIQVDRKIPVLLLGAGMMDYDSKYSEKYRDFIDRCNVKFISTRDEATYEYLSGMNLSNTVLHNGIDLAFFLPKFYHKNTLKKELIVLNFDQIDEPKFKEVDSGEIQINHQSFTYRVGNKSEPLKLFKKFAPFVKWIWQRDINRELLINHDNILRTEHRYNPYFGKKIYSKSRTFASDHPTGYIDIYSNSKLTLSNRVHACALTLANGGKAMYFSNSKRAALLDRVVGDDSYTEKPVRINSSIIEDEYVNLIKALKNVIKD